MSELTGRYVEHIDRGEACAGDFSFATRYSDKSDNPKPCTLLFICPCGCGKLGALDLKGPYAYEPASADGRAQWDWDGSRERPTLTPSILDHNLNSKGERIGEHWHGYLTAGVWKKC